MGILHRIRDGAYLHLPADALMGRGASFDVPLQDERVSAPHARLRWMRNRWYIQDLASRNGTYVNGNKLGPGERKRLSKQATVALGTVEEEYRLIDASAPTPLARNLATGLTVPMVDGLLVLPSQERALASIYPSREADLDLIIDVGNRVSPVIDREIILLDGTHWQLRTQIVGNQQSALVSNAMTVDTIALTIKTSADLEEINLEVRHGDSLIKVGHNNWHELLLLLAEGRIRDASRPVAEQGWLERDLLCQMLNKPVEQLHVAIHRARNQFRGLGLLPAAALIERHRGSRALRIGVKNLSVERHKAPWQSSALTFSETDEQQVNTEKQTNEELSLDYIDTLLPDRYQSLEIIGSGLYSVVISVYDELLRRNIAIKLFDESSNPSELMRARIQHEHFITAGLNHAGVVPIYDRDPSDPCQWFAMGLVADTTLTDEIDRAWRQKPDKEVIERLIQLVLEAIRVVAYAHDQGIVHMDIKPSNIMVDRRVFVVDWGLALELKSLSGVEKDVAIGTLAYMAPEQARAQQEHFGKHTDVFALGCVLYQSLTGLEPYRGHQVRLLDLARQGVVPDLTKNLEASGTPPGLTAIVEKATAPAPIDRYADAAELANALSTWLVHGDSAANSRTITAAIEEPVAEDASSYDVFLSHNSMDKPAVRELAAALRKRDLRVWLDEDELVPGRRWQTAIEKVIETAKTAAVLVGHDGLGPWEEPEMQACLSEFIKRKLPVIPVLLPGAPTEPKLPVFLSGFTWVDLRAGLSSEGLLKLEWGITGKKPQPQTAPPTQSVAPVPPTKPSGAAVYQPYPPELIIELEELTWLRARPPQSDSPRTQQTRQQRINELCAQLRRSRPAAEGDVVARAKLVRIVGKGNFGAVWQATDVDTGEQRAVKLFDADRLGLTLALRHFRRGVRAMKHLSHIKDCPPTVIKICQADQSHTEFSMEYRQGGDLTRITTRAWRTERKLDIFHAVAQAVRFAHDNDVYHRDIKPANIVLSADGVPALTDFDIADLLFATQQSAQAAGSMCYAAPENLQARSRPSPRGDVFSLGRLLYYLLTEQDPPVYGFNPAHSAVPPEYEALIRCATQIESEQRYPNVQSLLSEFNKYRASS